MPDAIVFLQPKGTIYEVVKAAAERGFVTLGFFQDDFDIHSIPSPYRPSARCLDRVYKVDSWLGDQDRIRQRLQHLESEFRIAGIYSGVDATMALCCELRQQYDLPSPLPEAMRKILNKYELRKILRQQGLSALKDFSRQEMSKMTSWPFPRGAYFKPSFGSGSAYVKYCTSLDDFSQAVKTWENSKPLMPVYLADYISAQPEYLLEEEAQGQLLSVEGIVDRNEFQLVGLRRTLRHSTNPVIEIGCCFPYQHPLADQIIEKVKAVHRAVGFSHGPTHCEVMVSDQGQIEVIDLNPRFIGADVLQSINHSLGCKIEEQLLRNCLGEKIHIPSQPQLYSCLQYFLSPQVDCLTHIDFPQGQEVKFSTTFFPFGQPLSGAESELEYVGCYLVCEPSQEEALRRAQELRKDVKINGEIPAVF